MICIGIFFLGILHKVNPILLGKTTENKIYNKFLYKNTWIIYINVYNIDIEKDKYRVSLNPATSRGESNL